MKKEIIHPFDERRKLALPGNSEETVLFAVSHFIKCANTAIKDHGAFYVALSGGSTPKKIFEKLSSPEYKDQIDWKKVFLFWSDERAVPPTDVDSNYKMAMDAGLGQLSIPKEHIFRMIGEKEIEKNAVAYESTIKKELKGRPFDLIMLGMGDDGHTASLFPGTKGLNIKDRLVIENFVPQKSSMRMTFTFTLINEANNIALYVLGKDKSDRVAAVLQDKAGTFPSGHVGSNKTPALWILDDLASEKLCKTLRIAS